MRVGSFGYCTDQGLGHLMKSFWDAGVVTDPLIMVHSRPNHFGWYPPGTHQVRTRAVDAAASTAWTDRIDVALFFETPFDWALIPRLRAAGKRTVLMPMYEWTLREPPHPFDLMLCPSRLDLDYFSAAAPDYRPGADNPGKPKWCKAATCLPVPVPQNTWRPRTRARRWLHNAGNVGWRHHKGTVELLRAVPLVKAKDWRMTVRAQDRQALQTAIEEAGYRGDRRVTLEAGVSLPYERLWDDHDVLIAPEKLNGLSLPLQEARAAGMLVMTTDRYPTNTWLPAAADDACHCGLGPEDHRCPGAAEHPYTPRGPSPLIPVARYERACVTPNYLEFDEAVVEPEAVAAKIDEWFDADVTAYSESARDWARANGWDALKPAYLEALRG